MPQRDLYPTLGLHSPDEAVVLNLGGDPFRFDVQAMIDNLNPNPYPEPYPYP